MNRDKLRNIIQELLNTGCEGTYWDFKEDYTDCRADNVDRYYLYGK